MGVYLDVELERRRAHAKHANNGQSMEARNPRDGLWLPVLTEEVGEVARAICDGSPMAHLREELIQVAAMACAWADAIAGVYAIDGVSE